MPSGVGKSGRKFLPSCTVSEQRRAISTLFSRASGRSAKSAAISSWVLKYCCSVKSFGRRLSDST
jgi:hypothetical protein